MEQHNSRSTKRSLALFLQAVTVLMGVATLTLMLVEPHFEGRNVHAKFFQVYFNDPFLAYTYIGSLPFFIGLFQTFKLLGFVRQGRAFSRAAVNNIKTIKYCAFITAGVVVAAGVYLKVTAASSNDDPAGAIMLGAVVTFASIVIGAAAAVFEKTLQSAAKEV